MSKTLSDILIDVNSFVDLDASLPVGTELTTRTDYANQAVLDASATGQLNEFNRVFDIDPVSEAVISLPSGFRELKHNPRQLVGGTWVEYEEIDPEERFNKDSDDNYCYILGNPSEGYKATFNNLTASCTLSFTYQAYPTGFPTLTAICELSDPTYVVAKVESYVLQARGDDRFPYVDAIADRKLKNMYGRGMKSPGGQGRVTPHGFKNPLS